jgi:hypothetical protein
MKTTSVKVMLALGLSAGMMLGGCKSSTPAPLVAADTPATVPALATTNADGSITNPDGSVTYPAGTMQAREAVGKKNADGSVTNSDGSITYPAGTSRARAVVPAVRRQTTESSGEKGSVPSPAGTAGVHTVPTGTRVAVSMGETLAASRNNAGDSFSGVLAEPLVSESGATVYARGTRVSGTVAAAKGRGRFKGAGDLAIELTSIGGQRVSTSEYEKAQSGKGKRTGAMIGGGAGLGAIIGGLAGGGKGALIGGLAGAGAGTAASAYTGNKDVIIPAESVITFTLTAPLSAR